MNLDTIYHADSLEFLKNIDDSSIDTLITDPPYALTSSEYKEGKNHKGGFMNKSWDAKLVSVDTWKECLRVLKPGSFAAIMSSPRQDVLARMIVNLQDAGFRTDFSSVIWTYSQGFPKAANTTKILKKRGITDKPELDGSFLGFQPKPALEVCLIVMKPLEKKSYIDQALANGKGITFLDACRIPHNEELKLTNRNERITETWKEGSRYHNETNNIASANPNGRFPANLLCSDDILNDGKITKSSSSPRKGGWSTNGSNEGWKRESHQDYQTEYRTGFANDSGSYSRYFDLDKWFSGRFPANLLCSDDILNDGKVHKSGKMKANTERKNQDGYAAPMPKNTLKETIGDSGSYSRYFSLDKWFDTTFPFIITPKASSSERNKGLDKWIEKKVNDGRKTEIDNPFQRGETPRKNIHPTCKPIKLMSWLVTLLSRENDTVLDPFIGSGTTAIAAKLLNRRYIGIDINKEYVDIARERLKCH